MTRSEAAARWEALKADGRRCHLCTMPGVGRFNGDWFCDACYGWLWKRRTEVFAVPEFRAAYEERAYKGAGR